MKINLKLPVWIKQAAAKLARRKWRHNTKINRWQRLSGRQRFSTATLALLSCGVIMFGLFNDIFRAVETMSRYELPSGAEKLLSEKQSYYSGFLHLKQKKDNFAYNEDYRVGLEESGQSGRPKFRALFSVDPKQGVSVTDPVNETSIKLTPLFGLAQPEQELNRLIYPLTGRDGAKVVTLGSAGYKEDIVLYKDQGDMAEFAYELELPDGVEARLENDGSVGFYGVSEALLGNVSTGSEADAQLLEKARQNGAKTNLLFKSPAPFILDGWRSVSKEATAWYSLDGNRLTLHADGLSGAKYPLSVDPSIYVETAAKLMRGNNETNVDFDVSNELIQKSQTTGARIDAWEGNLDMTTGTFDHATAAAGGYVYRTGGRTGPSKPQIVDSEVSVSGGADTTSFTMDMPATRPAGDLYIALMCHDGTGTPTAPAGGGWTNYADEDEHAAYYKIGTDQGGGNEAASYTWTGIDEEWAGVIIRVTGFNAADIISGTPGTNNTSGVPQFPATTPDNNATLVIRAVGADNDAPSETGWVPAGHTKIASDTSSNTTGDCGFAAASLDNSPASGVSTGTASLGEMNDEYGGSTIAINPVSVTPATEDSVHWAQFNSSTLEIESPNPGAGVCSGWCTDSAYDLPEPRRGHSMVAYNGYLYVLGGLNDSGSRESTVYIAKLGVNGEPSLWHPTDTNKNNWDYWYEAALNGPTAKSYLAAVAYNNRMYVLGGQTNASSGGVTTVERADILPNGSLGSWTTTGMQALPAGAGTHMHSVQVYNDTLYTIGGFEGAATSSANMRSAVYYSKLNSDGTMNSWQVTDSFATARSSHGGTMSAIWGAYIYLGGGCTAVNASGYCTTIASDMQIASINADGTLDDWHSLGTLDNTRIGYTFIAWQGGLYRLGGCTTQNTSTGECTVTLADVDYGVVNPAGEVSTVNISVPSGTAPCSGADPVSCDLPTIGDDAGEIGHMLNQSAILNGYLYVIGGCAEYNCNTGDNTPTTDNISSNTAYVAIAPDGTLSEPPSCGGTVYGAWCVDSSNTINGADGVAAGGVAIFNGRLYVLGGIDSTGNTTGELYYNTPDATTGAIGSWTAQTLSSVNIGEDIFYTYIYARANPSQAGTYPGNLYIFGGCGNGGSGAGCGASDYETEVYKCWIETGGAIENTAGSATFDCTTTGQMQIDSTPGAGGTDGLGIHSGTVYANYIYLIGGFSQAEADKDDVLYARFDNNNNVVAASGSTWIESPNKLSVGRRRGWAFGYNGHIYSVGGYDEDDTTIIPFIEWSKINVSDGSINSFTTSSVTINQRWGLTMAVSNSYAYVIGGCDDGASPSDCESFEASLQTFQLYNNDSGAVNDFTAQGDDTFAANDDRIGASAAIYNGYLYVAGGCTNIGCTTVTDNVQFVQLNPANGSLSGNWASTTDSTLPAGRAWGSLEAVGGTLYYIGGQTGTSTDERPEIYYGTPSAGNVSAWNTVNSANDLPNGRTQFGSAVWNNRIYVVGGVAASSGNTITTVYVSPQLSSGGDIPSTWSTTTAFNVARAGAAVTAYANNLYLFGGFDGTNYLSDVQFTQINSDGTVDAWTYTTNLPVGLRDATAVSANGYIYLIGGRTAATTCTPKVLITPISANTTIATGNNPTGVGEWYETNVRYGGDRYGAAVAYDDGKIYTMTGGCSAILDCSTGTVCNYESTVLSQPQVAIYSRLIDTDTDVFPNSWLMNGVDNSIGARWNVRYRSMNDTDGVATDCGPADMTTWGQETNYGEVTLGDVAPYVPLNGSGTDIDCARYFYFFISIDASKTFGYPEDVERGPTIADITLFFTADPSKRLRHGKTFTGGEKQPLDTPCRQSVDSDCPMPAL